MGLGKVLLIGALVALVVYLLVMATGYFLHCRRYRRYVAFWHMATPIERQYKTIWPMDQLEFIDKERHFGKYGRDWSYYPPQ